MTPPRKVFQYSLARSGSTVVWQVLKYLFPDSILCKRHCPPPLTELTPVVLTVRDPRDRVASRYRKLRAGNRPLQSRRMLDRQLDENERHFQQLSEYLKEHAALPPERRPPLLILFYEQYYEKFEFLLQELARFFGVDITPEQLDYVQTHFSVESNLAISSKLKTFHELDHESNIHGNHISPDYLGAPLCWAQIIDPSLHKYTMKRLRLQLHYVEQLRKRRQDTEQVLVEA
jgi:hypothetical protein